MKRLNPEQTARLKEVVKNVAIVLLIGLGYYAFIKIAGFGIPCLFYVITKLHCAGCGISRMFVALASLDFKAAFGYNCVALILLPFILFFVTRHYVIYILKGKQENNKLEIVLLIIVLIIEILFTILRNIPYFYFLAP